MTDKITDFEIIDFDEKTMLFRTETGIWPPGRDMPAAMCGGEDEYQIRMRAYDYWCRTTKRIKELEADLANYFEMAAKSYTACGNYQQRIGELETEMQEVSNQLIELYNQCNETTKPEIYGTILGLHERLEQTLKS